MSYECTMGKYKNKQEIDKDLDQFCEDLADLNSKNGLWKDTLASIFCSGILHKDPATGVMITSEQVSVTEIKSSSGKVHDLYSTLFSGSKELIREVDRAENTPTLMGWYCRVNGISTAELFELGTNPDSPTSLATKEKLEGLKQGFYDLINSNDPEKISDFYVDVYASFQEDYPTMLTTTDMDKLKENYAYYSVWTASESFITQSLENSSSYKQTTEREHLNCRLIEEKLKKKFGPEVDLGTMAGQMGPANALMQLNGSHAFKSKENFQQELATKSGKDLEQEKSNNRLRVTDAFRAIKAPVDYYQYQLNIGKPVSTTSKGLASAYGIIQTGYTDFMNQDDFGSEVSSGGSYYESEYASMLGDTTYQPIFDTSLVGTKPIVKVSEITHVNFSPISDDLMDVIHVDELKSCRDALKDGSFIDQFQQKVKDNVPLSYAELFTFSSLENKDFTPSMREKVHQFLSSDGTRRLSSLDKTTRYLVDNITRIQYNMSAVDYANGGLVERQIASQYQLHSERIRNGLTTQPISSVVHKSQMDELKKSMKRVGSTANSSDEFKKMAAAFNALDSKEPNYPEGNSIDYQRKLKALADAADAYIKAKEADGKKERFTDRGQVRYQMAKRMAAFAKTSMSCIEKTMQLAKKDIRLASIAAQPTKDLMVNSDVTRRIDTLMGPTNGHCQDLIDLHVYDKEKLSVSTIEYPKDVPFTDHEIALIGVAALSQGSILKGTDLYYPNCTEQQIGLTGMLHTTVDIFYAPRANVREKIITGIQDARQMAHDSIIEYMNGNKEPLAKMIGTNMKGMLLMNRSYPDYTVQSHDLSKTSQEMMQLLAKDPELANLSGLSVQEMQDIKGYEVAARLYEEGTYARVALLQDMKKPTLNDSQKQDLLAEAYLIALVSNQGSDCYDKNVNEVQTLPEFADYTMSFVDCANAKQERDKLEKEGISGPEYQAALEKCFQADIKVQGYQHKMDLLASEKGSSFIISNSGKNLADYDSGKKLLMNTIKQTDAFKELYNSGKWMDLITNDRKLVSYNKIHVEFETKKAALKQASVQKDVQKEGPKKVEEKQKKKEEKVTAINKVKTV